MILAYHDEWCWMLNTTGTPQPGNDPMVNFEWFLNGDPKNLSKSSTDLSTLGTHGRHKAPRQHKLTSARDHRRTQRFHKIPEYQEQWKIQKNVFRQMFQSARSLGIIYEFCAQMALQGEDTKSEIPKVIFSPNAFQLLIIYPALSKSTPPVPKVTSPRLFSGWAEFAQPSKKKQIMMTFACL